MEVLEKIDQTEVGLEMYQLISRLFPICRSITGNGVRETLTILKEYLPLEIHEVPTGTQVFDWTVPKEWNIRDAYLKDDEGNKIVDFKECNLHVLNYSLPIHKKLSLDELKPHLFSDPAHPDWVPYKTSYYNENWGICLPHNQLLSLKDGLYEVCIDSTLEEGSLTYGEYYVEGEMEDEVLISCHICHPSLANDNLSGISIAINIAKWVTRIKPRYSYRFVFVPGTIGSITWLSINRENVSKIKFGLVATLLGDPGSFTYKKTRRGNAEIDEIVQYVLKERSTDHKVIEFFPYGYDERQYCSPGFNLPVGCLMRTPHGQYKEYHTSADNLDLVTREKLEESYSVIQDTIRIIENNRKYINKNPFCEPQLGKRGLYKSINGKQNEMAMLWVLNQSDGENSLMDIAIKSEIPFKIIYEVAKTLLNYGLLE
jgi:aminopeptidase-like protein